MHAIALIVQPGSVPSSVTSTLDIFGIADRFTAVENRVRLDLLSAAGGAIKLSELISVETQCIPASLTGYDAVIIPGFLAADVTSLDEQLRTIWQPVITKLRAIDHGPLVGASCYATFVLAESGLLDGKSAATTWWLQREFGERYSKVRLDADKALIVDGKRITAGAMTAHIDLSMQVLRSLKGADMARCVASIMLVNDARTSQRPFMLLPRHFTDPLAQRAADWMAEHIAQEFSARELAAACHVSYRTLHRRFSDAARRPPLEYLQALRVEHAKALLDVDGMSLEEIVTKVGYIDVSSFRRLFSRLVGLSPAQYRRQFQRAGRLH